VTLLTLMAFFPFVVDTFLFVQVAWAVGQSLEFDKHAISGLSDIDFSTGVTIPRRPKLIHLHGEYVAARGMGTLCWRHGGCTSSHFLPISFTAGATHAVFAHLFLPTPPPTPPIALAYPRCFINAFAWGLLLPVGAFCARFTRHLKPGMVRATTAHFLHTHCWRSNRLPR
jgi:hypothetical protein